MTYVYVLCGFTSSNNDQERKNVEDICIVALFKVLGRNTLNVYTCEWYLAGIYKWQHAGLSFTESMPKKQ